MCHGQLKQLREKINITRRRRRGRERERTFELPYSLPVTPRVAVAALANTRRRVEDSDVQA